MDIQCESCGEGHLINQCQALDGFFVLVCKVCKHKTSIGPVPRYQGPQHDVDENTSLANVAETDSIASETHDQSTAQDGLKCPKCKWPKAAEDDACPRCGLVPKAANPKQLERWNNPLRGHPLEKELPARWDMLKTDWSNEEGHRQFIAMCASHRLLTFAGSCYREALDADPENEKAAEYRQKVIQAALVEAGHLDQKISQMTASSKKGLATFLTGAFLLLLFACAYYFITQSQTAWQFDR